MRKIVIAIPKGKRMPKDSYAFFAGKGLTSKALEEELKDQKGKNLSFLSDDERITFLLVKNADIPQYVDKNWADIGISAFDCFREYELSGRTEGNSLNGYNFVSDIFPDLGLCPKSRFCIAGKKDGKSFYEKCKKSDEKILTVATQYPHIANSFFNKKGITADIIYIAGSSELAPVQGDVDAIFDIVETGSALKKNGLIIYEEAMPLITKILVSKAALKYDEKIEKLIKELI
jgi:ATP phosphoribosyltransferase